VDSDLYDYVVVGAGSAGAVVANRLSADPSNRVLLLEAGQESNAWVSIPIGFAKLIDNPKANWCYSSEPDAGSGQRRIPVPRGKLLGGSSSINGMVFVRGQARDYDTWAQLGNRGWSYSDVLPIFRDMESYLGDGDDGFRGRKGPLMVTENRETGGLYDKIFAAAEQVGLERQADYNGATQDGISMSQTTIRNGKRMSTAYCYLDPVQHRPNLIIRANAMAECLLFEGKKCVGVRLRVGSFVREVKVRKEVIVSAGSINSPQLLEVSGIGQADRLRELGIEVVHELKGVGENLRDHYAPRLRWSVDPKLGLTYNDKGRGLGLIRQALKYAFTRQGLLGITAAPMRAFIRTRPGLDSPNALIGWIPFLIGPNFKLARQSGVTAFTHILRSESTGSIHIKSTEISTPPAINFNFFSAQLDREVTLEAMGFLRRLMSAPALERIITAELAPGAHLQSDEELLQWIRQNAETTYHPVGTCKMGSDPMAVVDEQLRVHGVAGLRIADASIMPTLTSGNTNAPSIMIGEKAARMILAPNAAQTDVSNRVASVPEETAPVERSSAPNPIP